MTKLERNIAYSLPLISILVEIIRSFLGDDTKIMAIRNYFFFLVILFLIIKYFSKAIRFNLFLILFFIYLALLFIVYDVTLEQFNDWIRAFDAKMLLPVGFILTSRYEHLQQLNKRLLATNLLFVSSIIIFSILGVGKNQYGSQSGFNVGYFNFSNIYIGSFLLLILPVIYSDLKSKAEKYGIALLGIVTLIILVLSVRRTALVIVFIGAVVYLYLFRHYLSKIVINFLLIVFILFLSFPLYSDILLKQIEARSNVFNDGGVVEGLEKEYRLKETIAVWDERVMNPDLRILLFGDHLFDSPGNYNNGIFGARPIHLDLNLILHGSGLVGLVLLLCIYVNVFVKYIELKIKLHLSNDKAILGSFLGIFMSLLFLLFSGGMLTITFNMISFLYLGAILGLFQSARTEKITLKSSLISKKPNNVKPYMYELNEKQNSRKSTVM